MNRSPRQVSARRLWSGSVSHLGSAIVAFAGMLAAQTEAARPNLVFILADDCTVWDLGCYGGQAHTPHLDRLATEGMRFTRCFQAAPMCSPTRHNLLTGQWPVTTGAYPNHTRVKPGTKSIAHYFEAVGYRVALSGKKHIAPRKSFPFEYSGKNNPDMDAIGKLMAECVEAGTPFCLFACSNEPHSPWNKGDPKRYDVDALKLPPYFVDTPATRAAFRSYLAEVTYFDSQVGRVLALLDEHGLRENTLVCVASEQGSAFPFAKWTCYGMGLQSACVVRWPGHVQPGATSQALVEYIDIVPTFLEAADAKRPKALQGRSFLPVLRGERREHKSHSFGLMTTRGILNGSEHFGIRTVFDGRYRLIWNLTPEVPFRNACTNTPFFAEWRSRARDGDVRARRLVERYTRRPRFELYDVTTDRFEQTDLAELPQHAARVKSLEQRLRAWMKLCGDAGQATELSASENQVRRRRKPLSPRERDRRGDAYLKAGEFVAAIRDFDAFLEHEPRAEPHHWRRGIAYYYAGEFAKGARQFEIHRAVNPADVENAVWHFLCKAELEGVPAARKALLACRPDARVPMMKIYDLFSGKARLEDVLEEARGAKGTRQAESALFYAHLYAGLYSEATGDRERAKRHMSLAATVHTSPHYMGDIARMHARLR